MLASSATPASSTIQITSDQPLVLRLPGDRLTASGVTLQSGAYQLRAGDVEIDRAAGTATLSGGVFLDREDAASADWMEEPLGVIETLARRLREDQLAIRADSAEVIREGEMSAVLFSGNPTISIPEGKLLANSVYLQDNPQLLRASDVRLGDGVLMVSAESVEVTDERTVLRQLRFFLVEPSRAGIFLQAAEAELAGDGNIRLRRVKAGVGRVPILFMPRWNVKESPPLVIFGGRIGTRSRFGIFAEAELRASTRLAGGDLVIEPGISAFTQRGVLPRPAARWKTETERGQRLAIDFDSSFIRDEGGTFRRGTDSRGRQVPINRHHTLLRSHGYDPVGGYYLFQGDWRSDSEFFRDYHRRLNRSHYDPDSFLETGTPVGPLIFSTLTRFRARDDQSASEALPAVSLDLPASTFGPGQTAWTAGARHARLRLTDGFGERLSTAERSEFLLQVEQPIPVGEAVAITPVAGTRLSRYDRDREGDGSFSRPIGQLGLDIEGRFHANTDYQSPVLRLDGLQHVLRPGLEYRWFPGADRERDRLPLLEPRPYTSGIAPVGLLDRPEVETLGGTQLIRTSMGNVFFTRDEGRFSRRIASIDLAQDFVLAGDPDPYPRSSLATSATLSPAPWLELEVFSRVDSASMTLLEILPELRFSDGDLWSLAVTYEGLQRQINELTTAFEYQLNYRTRLLNFFRYNGQSGQLTEQVYGFERIINREWSLRCAVSLVRNDARRENFRLSTTLVTRLF